MPEVACPPRVHVFDCERLGACLHELMPLAERHFEETARFKVGGCRPDLSVYAQLESAGALRTYTIREIGGSAAIGYCLMIVRRHHHTNQIRAFEDLLYVIPERRGIGTGFIRWMDTQLMGEGVQVIQRTCQTSHDHGRIYARLGYDKTEETWSRQIGAEHG